MHQYTLGHDWLESSSAEKGVGVQQVDHEPATCPCNKEGQCQPGLSEEERCHQVKGSDPSPLLSIGETHLECWVQSWAPRYKTDMDILEKAQQKVTKMTKGLEHL